MFCFGAEKYGRRSVGHRERPRLSDNLFYGIKTTCSRYRKANVNQQNITFADVSTSCSSCLLQCTLCTHTSAHMMPITLQIFRTTCVYTILHCVDNNYLELEDSTYDRTGTLSILSSKRILYCLTVVRHCKCLHGYILRNFLTKDKSMYCLHIVDVGLLLYRNTGGCRLFVRRYTTLSLYGNNLLRHFAIPAVASTYNFRLTIPNILRCNPPKTPDVLKRGQSF